MGRGAKTPKVGSGELKNKDSEKGRGARQGLLCRPAARGLGRGAGHIGPRELLGQVRRDTKPDGPERSYMN